MLHQAYIDGQRGRFTVLQAGDLSGVIPACTTPITDDESIDREAVARIIEYFLDAGVGGIFVLGSSGEAPSMTDEQRAEMVATAADGLAGRAPLLAGVSSTSFGRSLQCAHDVADHGADAIVATCPFYFFYGQEDLYNYFTQLAERGPLPLVIYDIPAHADNEIEVGTLLRLSEHERILGVKNSTGDLARAIRIANALGDRDDFVIFEGSEPLIAPSMLMGMDGAVLGIANACPHLCVELVEAAAEGQVERARELQARLNQIFPMFFAAEPETFNVGGIVGAMKAAQEILGLCKRRTFFPARQLTDEDLEKIRAIIGPAIEAGWIKMP